jgi:hypothetical protein
MITDNPITSHLLADFAQTLTSQERVKLMELVDNNANLSQYPDKWQKIIRGEDVRKHGTHDQKTHGNWADGNFDEETQRESAYLEYSETFGVDAQGNYVGTTSYEANAVLSYSGNGYMRTNYYARGLHETEDEISLAAAMQVVLHNPELFDAAIESYSESNPGEVNPDSGELSGTAEQEAIYRYIDANGPKVMEAFRAGKTEEAETAKRSIERLDAVIDKAPATFGATNLYRVFADDVLANLEEGDVLVDRGFMSTSRIDLTSSESTRTHLGRIDDTPDTVAVILPNASKSGKGLAVDIYKELLGEPMGQSSREDEVLLPRGTPLKFLGYKTDVGSEARIAVFERVDG